MKKIALFMYLIMLGVLSAFPAFANDDCAIAEGKDVLVPYSAFIKGGMDLEDMGNRPIYAATREYDWLRELSNNKNLSQQSIEKILARYKMTPVERNGRTYLKAANLRGKQFHPIQSLPGRNNSLAENDRFYFQMEKVYTACDGCVIANPTLMYFVK